MIEWLADLLLDRALPHGDTGRSIKADLHEEWAALRERHPGRRFRLWLLRESLKLSFHFLIHRLAEGEIHGPGRGAGNSFGGRVSGSVGQDLRFAVRSLRRRPVFAGVSVLTLALGIGSAAAMFSVVDGVLVRSVPFEKPHQLVDVWLTAPDARGAPGLVGRTWNRLPLSLVEFRTWQAQNTVFDGMAVHNAVETTLTGEDTAERITIGYGSTTLLSVLGVQPMLGRWFLPSEEGDVTGGGALVTVVSYDTWRNRLSSDPRVLGRTILLGGKAYTIVGVLPPDFRLRHLGMHWLGEDQRGERDVWAPLGSAAGLGNGNNLEAIARLDPAVPLEDAQREASAILLADHREGEVRIVSRSDDETSGLASPLLLLLAATGVLLLIACANIATLSLGELHSRTPELSTRAALGAAKGRIVRQLMVESLVLGALGAAVGVLFAYVGTAALVSLAPPLPRVEAVGINLTVLGFSGGAGVMAAVLFGTVPAVVSARTSAAGMAATTRTTTSRRGGFERWIVSLEIAMTVVLLVSGGLLARSFRKLLDVDPGFPAAGLATASVYLPAERYATGAEMLTAYDEILAKVEALPGVVQASAITRLPFPGLTNTTTLTVPGGDGGEDLHISIQQLVAMPDYHETMGIPLRAGSYLADTDSREPLGVVITENVARRYWPNGSPVGVTFRLWGKDATIVGVGGDVKRNALGVDADPAFYSSLRQRPAREVSLVARTTGDAEALASEIASTVRAYDPGIPVRQVSTLPDLIRASASQERYRTLLMEVFAILAALLAAVGVFGIAARDVARRTKEMGVRYSLGAEERGLVAMVVKEALAPGFAGAVAGLVLAAWVGRALSGFLFGVQAFDPFTYAAVASFLALVSALASYLPARRIASMDPAEVLRSL